MDTRTLNKIPIKEYLASFGLHPARERGYYGMYYSPFREDRNASLKVDFNKNLWIDFGTNIGGTLIDIIMLLERCSLLEAICKLKYRAKDSTFVLDICKGNYPITTPEKQGSSISITKLQLLEHPALIRYLDSRKISIDTARVHCPEVYYSFGEREYFAIGFKNDSGGYELRNRYFKGSTSKDITTINVGHNSCLVFEGFMDYLSYLTLKSVKRTHQNVVVLNSVCNLSRAKEFIVTHSSVYAFLDNDPPGEQATAELSTFCTLLYKQSKLYLPHKGLNQFLCNSTKRQHRQSNPAVLF